MQHIHDIEENKKPLGYKEFSTNTSFFIKTVTNHTNGTKKVLQVYNYYSTNDTSYSNHQKIKESFSVLTSNTSDYQTLSQSNVTQMSSIGLQMN